MRPWGRAPDRVKFVPQLRVTLRTVATTIAQCDDHPPASRILRLTRRALLWGGVAVAASGVASARPADAQQNAGLALPTAGTKQPVGVAFTTTGATFTPEVELIPTSTATVRWLDSLGRELARGPRPSIDFGSAATRTVVMATTFSHVLSLNLGFDSEADAGDYGPGEAYNKPPESVTRVSGLTKLTHLRQVLASGTQLAGKLDVSGLTHLRYIECFHTQLTSIDLSGCKRLLRLCIEGNRLTTLDLNPVAGSLRDLRAAEQSSGRLKFAKLKRPLTRLYHLCVRDQVVTGHPSRAQLPACRELWNWNTGQKGQLPTPGGADSVMSYGNHYRSVDVSGKWQFDGYGILDLTDNQLVSVKLTRCRGLISIMLSGNKLPRAQVDRILVEVASWKTSGGWLVLDGSNASPSAVGLAAANMLRERGWEVTTTQ